MSQEQRVFITGLSALTSSGLDLASTWDALIKGESGIAPITNWEIESYPSQLGGELKGFEPAKMLPDKKMVKVISKQDAFGINAAMQAVLHSECITYRDTLEDTTAFNDEFAVFVGSPGNKYCQQYDFLPLVASHGKDFKRFAEDLFNVVHPTWLLRILPNNVLAYTGIAYGFKGPNHNISNHAVSGMQALIEAYHALKSGEASRAVVVAYDLSIEPQGLFYYDKLGVLSATGLKPYDKAHDGTILGEGASALVLETEASVNARGAKVYAEVVGGFSESEGKSLFSLDESGKPLAELIDRTLTSLDLSPNDIGAVVAHGNGNIKSDVSEARAIVSTLGHVPVTSFKWSMGHTLAASGLLDTVLAANALCEQTLPGVATFSQLAPDCNGLNVSQVHKTLDRNTHVMIINRGFASMNACLVIKGC